jgi:23S rRNA (cytosine1962-C5)-methyltransferase
MTVLSKIETPSIDLLESNNWEEYELLDSGNGLKLERYGQYRLVRPEPEALWQPSLPESEWQADAVFKMTSEKHGGHWQNIHQVPKRWKMRYGDLRFWVHASGSRHVGVFPEQGTHWDWIQEQIKTSPKQSLNVLNLFGYSGLATLAAAQAGARVTHLDASRSAVSMASDNLKLSGLEDKPVRWILEDAYKFVQREARRGNQYDGLILDPPKFGRGPKGEVWEFYKLLPDLLGNCRKILSDQPRFVVLTAYAVKASAVTLYNAMEDMMSAYQGATHVGELVQVDKSAGRVLSKAVFARWSNK